MNDYWLPSVYRMSLVDIAREALEHVIDGDSYGIKAKNPTNIRTRQLLERLANNILDNNKEMG